MKTTTSPLADTRGGTVRVWDLPTRIFHWLLVFSFTGAWLTAESERYRDVHLMFGYTVAGLLLFRIVWGFTGSRWARFSSFVFPPSRLAGYLHSLRARRPQHHAGHNPLGALAVFLLLGLGLATAACGFATYQELGGKWLKEVHEAGAQLMLAIVIVHVMGVIVSSLLHRENLARAMVTGSKRGRPDEGIASRHAVVGVLLLVAVLAFWSADRAGWLGTPVVAEPTHAAHQARD
ncbi:cytochrome B [Azoarcus indigens]|uniref:Cytochrome b n=1 Tax=Azoarcus indigens TaxID=29545 RepID=A0A4R6EEG6_9RHOO|nr:cytochrome b/b6 domain-containing protein [Azoarcus indigens]NMG63609.1 cytochrome B [Azoarcus indigens]TDN56144.1 cytochrome b [Azoarcus indigens]